LQISDFQPIERIESAAAAGLRVFLVTVPVVGAQWADENFYLSPESSGTEGRWTCYPYQIGIINWMTSDDIEEVNWMKSRRVGYTKCLLAATASLIVQKNRNVAIWQPTDSDAKDFTTDEVETVLRDVPALGRRLKCQVGVKSKYNTLEKKVFNGATLDIKGGKSPRNFRRMTKDVAIYDELSAFDLDIGGEGTATEIGDGRLDQAPFPKSIRGSTPKLKGSCQIEAAVERAGMVFYRFVKCPHCGSFQRFEFKNLEWEKGRPETAHFRCPHNGCRIEYRDYPVMDANGRWQTLDGYYYDDATDRFFDAQDNPIPKPRTIGARIWAAYSYLRPWSYFVEKWISANKEAKNGNITLLKAVINTLLGETFEDKGEKISFSKLAQRGEDYLADGTIPAEVLAITAGADVQGGANPRIELEIVGHGIEYETWSLDYVVLPGDAEGAAVWDHLDEQLQRTFKRTDGVNMAISCTFVDSGYLASEVYKFTSPRQRRGIFATKGVNTGLLCNKGTWQGDKRKGRAILRTVNVDDAKTIVYNRLRIKKPGPGYCHFPNHYDDRYFKNLTNETKRIKRRRGVVVGHEWVKKGANEPLDCRCYAIGALEFLKPNWPAAKHRLEQIAAKIKDKKKPKQASLDLEPKKSKSTVIRRRRQPARGGFVNGWKR
jgi:phage terminase large subunit GpA-like protein